jgi:hypothetical protein
VAPLDFTEFCIQVVGQEGDGDGGGRTERAALLSFNMHYILSYVLLSRKLAKKKSIDLPVVFNFIRGYIIVELVE